MYTYDTVSEAISNLKARGYTLDFNLQKDQVDCNALPLALQPDEFEIMETYRFEGDSNPDDEAIVYAIASKHGHKGVLVNGFGPSADTLSNEIVKKLSLLR
jgi:hypothetical protein